MTPEERRAYGRAWYRAHPTYSRDWKAAHRDEVNAQQRALAAADPERFRAYRAKYRATHGEELRAGYRKWAAANPEKTRAWAKANPERRREITRSGEATRKARKRAAFVERVDVAVVWERDQGVCHICGQPADPSRWDLDHVIPLALGGMHSYANVKVSHPICNYRKGTRHSKEKAA